MKVAWECEMVLIWIGK